MMWESLSKSKTIGFSAAVIITFYTARLLLRSRRNRRKITRIIDTIEELQKSSVRMKDPNLVEDKVCQLIKGGHKKLQIITDFDMTLTRFHLNGTRCSSCHGAIETSPKMPQQYRQAVKGYKEQYYPIEVDPTLTSEQKIPFMVEWWSKAHKLLVETDLNKNDLKEMVKKSSIHLRDGCHSFLEQMYESQVPVTIFSAGIGNILEEVLSQQGCFYNNIRVISNYLIFDKAGKIKEFSDIMIHVYNKNSCNLMTGNNIKGLKDRKNIILVGDSLGDINMDAGLAAVESVLRIGFLNENFEASLQKYLDSYDIVIIDDQTLDVLNGIIRKIL